MKPRPERIERFPCFGGTVAVRASGEAVAVAAALRRARRIAEDVHRRLTRFEPGSDLCRLNGDPRELVPAEPLLRRFAAAVAWAGEVSGGLVDATCLPAVEAAGYRRHWEPGAASAGWTAGAAVAASAGWADVAVEGDAVRRPPGTRLDSGGLGKGLAADLMATALGPCRTWAIDCGGDLRVGGWEAPARAVDVAAPDGEASIHRLRVARGAIATSGVTRRAWDAGHHLVDPRTGAPADTGIIQATAVAPTGLEAEVRAKTALLSGPERAGDVLSDGGVFVTTAGGVHVVARRNLARGCGNPHRVLRRPPLR